MIAFVLGVVSGILLTALLLVLLLADSSDKIYKCLACGRRSETPICICGGETRAII